MDINQLLKKTVDMKGSDLHITVGYYPCVRINGRLTYIGEEKLTATDTEKIVRQVADDQQLLEIEKNGDCDMSITLQNIGRFRANIFKQRGTYSMSVRCVQMNVPTLDELGMPAIIHELVLKKRGLIIVTGPTGSGKTTTLAAMINSINENRSNHILTLEDPIEYLHTHKKGIVNQRELKTDFKSFALGLRAGLRQDPDVILLGEMRDLETIEIALTAAETGHLVFSTLHTLGSVSTIDRIIDVFPQYQQQQVVVQLANVLEAVISQQLLPSIDGKSRMAAVEIMMTTPAVRNLIRERKTHQIPNIIQTGAKIGMQTMDSNLLSLYNAKKISYETLLSSSMDFESMRKLV